jgi:hypothetical protein
VLELSFASKKKIAKVLEAWFTKLLSSYATFLLHLFSSEKELHVL